MMGHIYGASEGDTRVRLLSYVSSKISKVAWIKNIFFCEKCVLVLGWFSTRRSADVCVLFQLDLDSIWRFMFGQNASEGVVGLAGKVTVCPEAITTLLAMVRTAIYQDNKRLLLFYLFLYFRKKELRQRRQWSHLTFSRFSSQIVSTLILESRLVVP